MPCSCCSFVQLATISDRSGETALIRLCRQGAGLAIGNGRKLLASRRNPRGNALLGIGFDEAFDIHQDVENVINHYTDLVPYRQTSPKNFLGPEQHCTLS